MGMPSTDADNTFEQLLQGLPADIVTLAIEFKAFTRSRKIKSATELLRAVLMFAGLDMTEREVAADLLLTNPRLKRLSDQAVHKRLSGCEVWLKAILPKMISLGELPVMSSGRRIIVVDGTAVRAPGDNKASYRLHVAMDLVSLQLVNVEITASKVGEKLKLLKIEPGSVYLADRGYCRRGDVDYVLKEGADAIVRYNARGFPVCELTGEPINVVKRLSKIAPGEEGTLAAAFRNDQGELKPVWIHYHRFSGVKAEAGRRRCRRTAQQSGYTPSEDTLMMNEFIMVLTTIAPSELDTEAVLGIYRCRWQIELLIKRWKSLLLLEKLRARQNSSLCNIYLNGKLLYALLLERRCRRRLGQQWAQLDQQRDRTWWRLWKLMRQEIGPMITGVSYWNTTDWKAAIKAITERSSNRKLQTIPIKVVTWLQRENSGAQPSVGSQPKDNAALAA